MNNSFFVKCFASGAFSVNSFWTRQFFPEALYNSVGAVQTWRTPPYPSTHNLGTNRMSAKAKDGVVDKWGRSHDIKNLFVADGSVMTTGAAANPTLTITALAIRTGEYLASELKKNNI